MLLIPLDDVLDECELAEIVERKARDEAINNITKDMPSIRFTPELIITDPELECEECGSIIPEARQRTVLTLQHTCRYCSECQGYLDKQNRNH